MIVKTLRNVQAFLKWLSLQKGYRSLARSGIEYLNPTTAEKRLAAVVRDKLIPSIKVLSAVVKNMPFETVLQRRGRAALALAVISGIRDRAQVSLQVQHIDPIERFVNQNPATGVVTKNRKHIRTWFFPVDSELDQIVLDWHSELIHKYHFPPTDPLFPATQQCQDASLCFKVDGLSREFWSTAEVLRGIYRQTCEDAGLPRSKLHHIRDALSALGMQVSRTPEMFKAWSQNLGHDSMLTTMLTYGKVSDQRQAEILKGLRGGPLITDESPVLTAIRQAAIALGYALVPLSSPSLST